LIIFAQSLVRLREVPSVTGGRSHDWNGKGRRINGITSEIEKRYNKSWGSYQKAKNIQRNFSRLTSFSEEEDGAHLTLLFFFSTEVVSVAPSSGKRLKLQLEKRRRR
jgi:hypothetical protein